MPFDPNTAKPEASGFNPATAKPLAEEKKSVPLVANALAHLDAGAALGSQMIAGPVSGLAGLGAVAAKAAGLTDKEPGDVVRSVGESLTYEPKTPVGKAGVEAVTYPFQKLAELGDYAGGRVAEATGSPAAGAGVNTAIQAIPMAVSKFAGGKVRTSIADKIAEEQSAALKANKLSAVKDATVKNAVEAGYVLPPSAAGDVGWGTKRLEGVAGKAALLQEVQIRNQRVTDSLARKAVEVADDVPLTVEVLTEKRGEFSKPYQEVASVSPRAATALERLQKARADANEWWTYYDRTAKPDAKAKAQAFSSQAEVLERVIDREATSAGKPSLLSELREARQKIAKTYDVERALNLGNGEVSARAIGAALDRGKPLSGELLTIAKFDRAFSGRFTRPAGAVPTPGVSQLEAPATAMLGMMGERSGAGWLPAGIPLAAGPTRSLLLSKAFQGLNTPAPYVPGVGLRGLGMIFEENAPLPIGAIQANQ